MENIDSTDNAENMNDMDDKIAVIKDWLDFGSINIFGLPMSGKDTVGIRLAETLGARFLSSGMIIRALEQEQNEHYTDNGDLAPTDVFYDWVLPYFKRKDLSGTALVLSSVGRWSGEENQVMEAAESANHPIKAAILLNVSEADVQLRWEAAHQAGQRDGQESKRLDDQEYSVFEKRIAEFREKTLPVVQHYQQLGLLIPVQADMTKEEVFALVIEKLYTFASAKLKERGY